MRPEDVVSFVVARPLIVERPRVVVPLLPGDRVATAVGAIVAPGDLLAERVRDPHLVDAVSDERGVPPRPGAWVPATPRRRRTSPAGELLFEHEGRRRIVAGPHPDLVAAPAGGAVVEIHPGVEIVLQLEGIGIPGSALLGDPGHGRLALLPGDADGRTLLDVAHAGNVVVFPGRVDAEALTRARAMGIAGAIVPAFSDRDRRDVVASDARQRAGLHRLAPFPVLVLDGYLRRALAGPVHDLFAALAGVDVGLVGGSSPMCVAGVSADVVPSPQPDRVRVRGGREAGHEGRFVGLAGPRRVAGGIAIETARLVLDDGRTVVLPLGDLERFA